MFSRKKKHVSQRQLYHRVAASNLQLAGHTRNTSSKTPRHNTINSTHSTSLVVNVLSNDATSSPEATTINNTPVSFARDATDYSVDCLPEVIHTNTNLQGDSNSTNLSQELADWAIKMQVSHRALTDLLHILQPYHIDKLPLDSRTLLQTPSHTKMKSLVNGKYCHFGLLSGLKTRLYMSNNYNYSNIHVSFNVDGLPIFKNGHNFQLWPILALIKDFESEPFVVGAFLGNGKPDSLSDYLEEFLNELKVLLSSGICVLDSCINLKIHSFVCDAPARAYLKCVKQHSGYASCDRCEDPGHYYGRMVFSDLAATKRDDLSFRQQRDTMYHLGDSPLLELLIDMVFNFVLDYMHVVCLGVMKKIIKIWLGQPMSYAKLHHSVLK